MKKDWIEEIIDREENTKQCDIHVVVCSVCGWSKEKDKECDYCLNQYARNWGL
jgi:hypothetical protein